jgi:integrase
MIIHIHNITYRGKRMGYSSDQFRDHGFRATFSTSAKESGRWISDAVERFLKQIDGNEVRQAYVRGEHWDERVRMADWWAEQVDQMKVASQ